MAGGAVNPGECKWTALMREANEELSVTVDESWGAVYLGGWQQGRARDNLINDNFAAFIAKLASRDFRPDRVEIHQAAFFEWRPMLDAWVAEGRPSEFKWAVPGSDERGKISKKLLGWLNTYATGRGLPVKITRGRQLDEDSVKMDIGVPELMPPAPPAQPAAAPVEMGA